MEGAEAGGRGVGRGRLGVVRHVVVAARLGPRVLGVAEVAVVVVELVSLAVALENEKELICALQDGLKQCQQHCLHRCFNIVYSTVNCTV